MEKKYLIIPWISLSCLLMGMVYNFCGSFGCQTEYIRFVLPIVLMTAAALFCIVQLKRKYALICSFLGVLGVTVFCVTRLERLQSDFLLIMQYMDSCSEKYSGRAFFSFSGRILYRTPPALNLFLYLALLCSAVFVSFVLFRCYKFTVGLLPVYVVTALGLLVGRAPGYEAVTCFVAGAAFARVWLSRQERGGKKYFLQKGVTKKKAVRVYVLFAFFLGAGLLTAKQLGANKEKAILKEADKHLEKQHQMEREATVLAEKVSKYIRSGISGESDGNLDNDEPYYTNSAVMKLTLPQKPLSDIYLKGFIGTEYKNGQWFAQDDDALSEIAYDDETVGDIWNNNYSFFSFCVPDETFEDEDNMWASYHVTQAFIEYVGKGRLARYAYMPYFADIHTVFGEGTEEPLELDGENAIRRKEDAYYVNFYPISSSCYGMVVDEINNNSYLGQDFEEYDTTQLEVNKKDEYYSYVKNTYSKYPNELSDLKNFILDYEVGGTWGTEKVNRLAALEAGQDVADILAQQAVYSMSLAPVPEDEDYAEYFLLRQRKGYCEHFATAGTLLLRAKGLPARFVQGYRVTCDMFEKNDDGTYTAEILDSNAHAWCEVYEGKYAGWFPIEMTPGDGENERPVSAPDNEVTTENKETFTGETEEIAEPEEPTALPEQTKPSKKGEEQKEPIEAQEVVQSESGAGVLLAFCAVAVAVLIFAFGLLQKRRRVIRRSREFQKLAENGKLLICIREEELLDFLKGCGQKDLQNQSEEIWCERLSMHCKEEYDERAWEEFKRIMQKAAFSAEDVTSSEVLYYCEMAEQIERLFWKRIGRCRKFYLRLLGMQKSE